MSDLDRLMGAVGSPKALDPERYPCRCVSVHVPISTVNHAHHVIPLYYGGLEKGETVSLCPSSHARLHQMLLQWEKDGKPGSSRHANRYLHRLALRAWEARQQLQRTPMKGKSRR